MAKSNIRHQNRPVSFQSGTSREPWSRWILTIRYVLIQNFWSMRGFNEWEIRKTLWWVSWFFGSISWESLVKVTEFLVMSWIWLIIYESLANSFWSFFQSAFVLQMKKLIWLVQQNRKMIVVSFLVYPIDVSDWSVSFFLGWSLAVEI